MSGLPLSKEKAKTRRHAKYGETLYGATRASGISRGCVLPSATDVLSSGDDNDNDDDDDQCKKCIYGFSFSLEKGQRALRML